jgi:Mrp family chromosome partitioning ATPase
MEKLRDAINKARNSRVAATPDSAPVAPLSAPAGDPARPAQPALRPADATDTAWAELAGFDPRPAALRRGRLPSHPDDPGFPVIDLLRTKVIQQARSNKWKRLLVTSPTPGCGKTTLTCALALSFSRQRDFRVVFCEVDLRRPAMAATLGYRPASPRQGFSDVLERKSEFAAEAVRIGASVAVCMNQAPIRNPSALILGNQVGEVIAGIEARYRPDLIVFDSPPMMASDDTLGFLRHVDSAMIVAAAELTTIQQIDQCERELAAQTSVLGTVLNKCRFVEGGYGYGEAY